jgi:hypothetical protein
MITNSGILEKTTTEKKTAGANLVRYLEIKLLIFKENSGISAFKI